MFGKAFRIAVGALALAVLAFVLYLSGFDRSNTAHAAGTDDQPWFMSIMDWSWIKEQVEHFRSNDDRDVKAFEGVAASVDSLSQTQKEILEQEKIQAEEAQKQTELEKIKVEEEKKQTSLMERMAKWFDKCGCVPWSMPRTGGGGGDHRHDPGTDPTNTPGPAATPTPTCSGHVYRWCEDGNILISTCDGKTFGEPWKCTVCREASEEGKAYCEAPTATSTSTPAPTPIPPTATPPPLVKTPNPGCPEAPHWVCDGDGNWRWKACGQTLCIVRCTYGCSPVSGYCRTIITDPTNTPGTGSSATPTRTSTTTATSGPPTHGPTLTRTRTPGPSATPTLHGDPAATATGLPIATKTPTQVRIPTATLTGPPTSTPSSKPCNKTDWEVTQDVRADGKMTVRPIGGTEDPCLFDWNGHGIATALAYCPAGYICTFDMNQVNGADIEPGVYLIDGDALTGAWTFRINRASFRWKAGYRADDPVWHRCVLLINERAFAFDGRHATGFEVWPFGFNCNAAELITTKSGRACPTFGMTGSQTYPLLTEWDSGKCKLPWQLFKRSGDVPSGWLLEAWDGTAVVKLGPGTYWEGFVASFWPQ